MVWVCILLFTIPLHAAQTADSGSPLPLRTAATIFPPLNHTLSRTTCESYRGSPVTFPHMSAKQRKEHSVCPARPPPTRYGPKLRLTSIPYIHRWGLRSRILARGLDHTSCSALSDAVPHFWGSNRSHSFCPPLERGGWLTSRVAGVRLVV